MRAEVSTKEGKFEEAVKEYKKAKQIVLSMRRFIRHWPLIMSS